MQTFADRYTLLERLGSGAMGVVWRARDELLHREVAIKQLLLPDLQPSQVEEACERAMREGRIAARLQHPNAIGVFDVVIEDGKPCLVMEYLPSRSLSEVLKERGTLPPAEAARIGAQVLAALAAAHEVGIVHRDIKPGNVLIGHNGSVKITDFGISRAAGDVAVTKTGALAGTLAYLAPELARGADPDPAADMFSFGATLYAMTEGQPPFGRSANEFGLLYKISTGQVTPPARSGPLTPLLTRLLAIEPAARPAAAQSVEELAALTGPASAPGSAAASAPGSATAIQPVRRGRRAGVAVAAAVLVLLVTTVVTATYLFGRDQAAGSGNGSTGQSSAGQSSTGQGSTGQGTSQSTPPPPSPAAALTTKDVDAFIKQHFAKLPKDTAGARQDWAPEFRPAEQKDDQYWKRYEVVAIYGDPRISSTAQDDQRFSVELDLTLRKHGAPSSDFPGKDVSIVGFRLDLVVRDGKLFIAHSRETGN